MKKGKLYTVATPIGNLTDISVRAIDTLKHVSLIAAEDTRETKKLLLEYDIVTPLTSYHAQSSEKKEDELLTQLREGHDIALVSDRGTPGISDPGERLIRRAVSEGVTVVPIPGATAVITALQAAGVSTTRFSFLGFIPHKKGRQTFLQLTLERAQEETVVFYESPHRILKCLSQLNGMDTAGIHIVVARELTKQYEEFLRGSISDVLNELSSREKIQGEFVVIVNKLH